jgi:dipeptidyl aminopeptidase/acylaminoacyl peptidase
VNATRKRWRPQSIAIAVPGTEPCDHRRLVRLLIALGTLGAFAALGSGCGGASADRAGLAFTRYANAGNESVWFADADGSHPRRLAPHGFNAMLSPDGRRVAYLVATKRRDELPMLYVRSVARGKPRRIGRAFGRWAPDSTHLAVSNSNTLQLVDVKSGERRRITSGHFYFVGGFSFAPDGTKLAYARDNGKVGPAYRSDIVVIRLSDLNTTQLTRDGHSDNPVWGRGWIVYRSFHFAGSWSIGRLRLMRPDGSGKRMLARGDERTSQAQMGLDPLEFSDDGRRLLTCAAAEFSCPPVTITVPDGKQYKLKENRAVHARESADAADLARDGSEVLVNVGPFDDPKNNRVYAIPFGGGKARLILRHATATSWAH